MLSYVSALKPKNLLKTTFKTLYELFFSCESGDGYAKLQISIAIRFFFQAPQILLDLDFL